MNVSTWLRDRGPQCTTLP